MGSPTQIWAARSAGTTARRPPATCVQASQPHRAISSHTPPDPELPKTTPAIGPAEGIIKGKARRPSKKLLWTAVRPGRSLAPAGSPQGIHPQTSLRRTQVLSNPPVFASAMPPAWITALPSPLSLFLSLPSPAQGPPPSPVPPQLHTHRDHSFPRADSIHCMCPSLDD